MPNAVQKAMQVLRILSDANGHAITLAALTEETGIPKSTIAHILKTLMEEGYVQRVSHREGYMIGPELHLLTRYGRYGEDIIHECHPLLRYINREGGGTAVFAMVKGGKKYIIDRVADDGVYLDEQANLLVDDLYRTVTGRVILANIPYHEALEIFENMGMPTEEDSWPEVDSSSGFRLELEQIRKQKCYYHYAIKDGYQWFAFAVPVFREKNCIGALGLSIRKNMEEAGPDKNTFEKTEKMMIRCRWELERRLCFDLL